MLSATIPFEIHITVKELPKQREGEFVDFCLKHAAKPLIIELSRGNFIKQPMLGKVVESNNVNEILSRANALSKSLEKIDLIPERLKIEIPARSYALLEKQKSSFEKYFEWHGKINYSNIEQLLAICEKQKVHLSRNSLKDEQNTRFITLREFGTFELFEQRVHSLTQELELGNWKIIKQEAEYCIYDNNTFLDKHWLPQ